MALRYELTESMAGTHHFVDPAFGSPAERRCYFELKWGSGVLAALNPLGARAKTNDARGVIFVEGLTNGDAPCEGTLVLDYPGRSIVYELDFESGSKRFHYRAEKRDVDLRKPLALAKTHTTAYGTLTDEAGSTISKSVLHFALDDVPRLLGSLRLRVRAT